MNNVIQMSFAKADAFGMIPERLRYLQPLLKSITPFDDEAVAKLRMYYKGIQIDRCIRAHITNITGLPEMQVSKAVIDSLQIFPEESAETEQLFTNTRLNFWPI